MRPFKLVYDQRMGSEYGGVQYENRAVRNTVQPKEPSAITPEEQLRLGYLTGEDHNAYSYEDLRQIVGLRHGDGRPSWFVTGQPFGPTYAEAMKEVQDNIDLTQNWQ